jgi:(E)-4-hydroxy-3-methylbut-2-enyl-diphosphate synthase
MHRNGTVFATMKSSDLADPSLYRKLGCEGSFGKAKLKSMTVDNVVLAEDVSVNGNDILRELKNIGVGLFSKYPNAAMIPIVSLPKALEERTLLKKSKQFSLQQAEDQRFPFAVELRDDPASMWDGILEVKPDLIILSPSTDRLHWCRRFFDWLQENQFACPVILRFRYDCSKEDLVLLSSMECGSLLCDGLGEGVWLEGPYPLDFLRSLSFSILQAARMRMSKTDFISCPSCGRTLFDLQDVTKRIQSRTAHLPGVKIAIMGCIVNGPGEMADADFGYVGSKLGKIDLYVGKECVEKDIDFSEADDRLIALIKAHDQWVDPEPAVEEQAAPSDD